MIVANTPIATAMLNSIGSSVASVFSSITIMWGSLMGTIIGTTGTKQVVIG